MFLRRSEFYMTIRVNHVFLLIFWGGGSGGRPPRKILEDFQAIFQHFRIVKLIFEFFQFFGARGGGQGKFFPDVIFLRPII